MSAAQTRALRSLAEPIVAALECDLEDIVIRQAGKRRLVRVVVDHAGGLPLDLVADISRQLSRALDEHDVLGQAAYVLEVTSPGVDRPLRLPRHWSRAVGRLVSVTPRTGDRFDGRVLAAGADHVTLDVAGGERAVAYADVARAVVQVEFSRIDEAALDDADDPGDVGAAADDAGQED